MQNISTVSFPAINPAQAAREQNSYANEVSRNQAVQETKAVRKQAVEQLAANIEKTQAALSGPSASGNRIDIYA